MSLSADEVKKIANLAKLHIEEREISTYAQHLSTILNFIEQISQVDTQDIEPMSHPLENMSQRMREDKITETVNRDVFQALSAHHEAGLYLVPLVIDEK
jgi:aspartyl-tRNA(Asn)/glutamyl-tRNA(Gln) amidotransferase subunit C